jgi:hypothetical protein
MTEMVTSGLMRGRWRRSDGPLEGDTRPKRGETAWPRTPCTPPRQRPTLLVFAFQYRDDAARFAEALRGRLGRFGLRLNEAKTRLIEFGRFAAGTAARRNQKPETFDFLGLTHICGVSRQGRFKILRQTASKRLRRAISRVAAWCREHRHLAVPVQWRYLCSVLRGHYQYYGVTGNLRSLKCFHLQLRRAWRKWLDRRSQRGRMSWERFRAVLQRHPLPAAWLPHSVFRLA